MMVFLDDVRWARAAGYSWEIVRAALKDVSTGISDFTTAIAFHSMMKG